MTNHLEGDGASGLSPEPIDGDRGAPILGPRNVALEAENPSLLASPWTDAGTVPNLKFPFAAARNRILTGGWAREVTTRELPAGTATWAALMGDLSNWSQSREDRRRLASVLAGLLTGAFASGLLIVHARTWAPVLALVLSATVVAVAALRFGEGVAPRGATRTGIARG